MLVGVAGNTVASIPIENTTLIVLSIGTSVSSAAGSEEDITKPFFVIKINVKLIKK